MLDWNDISIELLNPYLDGFHHPFYPIFLNQGVRDRQLKAIYRVLHKGALLNLKRSPGQVRIRAILRYGQTPNAVPEPRYSRSRATPRLLEELEHEHDTHRSTMVVRPHFNCLSDAGFEYTVRLRLLVLHPTENLVLALCDSCRFVIMTRSLPSPHRLHTYLLHWGFSIHEDDQSTWDFFAAQRASRKRKVARPVPLVYDDESDAQPVCVNMPDGRNWFTVFGLQRGHELVALKQHLGLPDLAADSTRSLFAKSDVDDEDDDSESGEDVDAADESKRSGSKAESRRSWRSQNVSEEIGNEEEEEVDDDADDDADEPDEEDEDEDDDDDSESENWNSRSTRRGKGTAHSTKRRGVPVVSSARRSTAVKKQSSKRGKFSGGSSESASSATSPISAASSSLSLSTATTRSRTAASNSPLPLTSSTSSNVLNIIAIPTLHKAMQPGSAGGALTGSRKRKSASTTPIAQAQAGNFKAGTEPSMTNSAATLTDLARHATMAATSILAEQSAHSSDNSTTQSSVQPATSSSRHVQSLQATLRGQSIVPTSLSKSASGSVSAFDFGSSPFLSSSFSSQSISSTLPFLVTSSSHDRHHASTPSMPVPSTFDAITMVDLTGPSFFAQPMTPNGSHHTSLSAAASTQSGNSSNSVGGSNLISPANLTFMPSALSDAPEQFPSPPSVHHHHQFRRVPSSSLDHDNSSWSGSANILQSSNSSSSLISSWSYGQF